MPATLNEQQSRQHMFDTMIINPGVQPKADVLTSKMLANKDRYDAIAKKVNPGLPWYVVSVIHNMECCLNFNKYLGNGQDLNKVTTIVPKGRGPFATFEAGADDALRLDKANKITDFSLGNLLYWLESFNGYGYEKYHNMPSPYLWSGCNYYVRGKYTDDGHFDPDAVSNQIGIALLLKKLL